MRSVVLILILVLLVLPLPAQEVNAEDQGLHLQAVGKSQARGSLAVIATHSQTRLVAEGDQVGELKILTISDEAVLAEVGGEKWKIEFEYKPGPKLLEFQPEKRFSMDVEGRDFEETVDKITRGMGADMICGGLDTALKGWLEDLSGKEALDGICTPREIEYLWEGKTFCVHRTGEKPQVAPGSLTPAVEEEALTLDARAADFVYLLHMIARLAGKNIYSDPDAQGIATAHLGSASPLGSARALAILQAASYGLVEKGDWWYVALPDRVAEFDRNPLWGDDPDLRPEIQLGQYVNADLVYMLQLVAGKTGRSTILAPDVEGSVTIQMAKPAPVLGVLTLMMNGQGRDGKSMDWTYGPQFLTSPPVDLDLDESDGPRLSYSAEEPWVQVPAVDVLKEVASTLELNLVLPADFEADIFVNLKDAPAKKSLDCITQVLGYRYTIEGKMLTLARK